MRIPELSATQITGARERLTAGLTICQVMQYPSPVLLLLLVRLAQDAGGAEQTAILYYTAFHSHERPASGLTSPIEYILDDFFETPDGSSKLDSVIREMERRLQEHTGWSQYTGPSVKWMQANLLDIVAELPIWATQVGGYKVPTINAMLTMHRCPSPGPWARSRETHLFRGVARTEKEIQTVYRPTGRVFTTDLQAFAKGLSVRDPHMKPGDSWAYYGKSKLVEIQCSYKSKYAVQSWSTSPHIAVSFALDAQGRGPKYHSHEEGTFSGESPSHVYPVVFQDRVQPEETLFNQMFFGLLEPSIDNENEVIRVVDGHKTVRGFVVVSLDVIENKLDAIRTTLDPLTYYTELFNAAVAKQLVS